MKFIKRNSNAIKSIQCYSNNNYLMITFLKKHGGVNLKIKEKVKNKINLSCIILATKGREKQCIMRLHSQVELFLSS